MSDNIKALVMEAMVPRMKQLEIREKEINGSFDLVRTGFVNSMEFVELLAGMEKMLNVEIDYEKALEDEEFTSVDGIIRAFNQIIDEH